MFLACNNEELNLWNRNVELILRKKITWTLLCVFFRPAIKVKNEEFQCST